MNKHFSLLLHSLLLVGALLPLSPLAETIQTAANPLASNPTTGDTVLAYGSGMPAFRGGGGTR